MRDTVTVQQSDLMAAIMALTPTRIGAPAKVWTPEMDAALLAGWTTRRKSDVAKLIGCSIDTARKRFEELAADRADVVQ